MKKYLLILFFISFFVQKKVYASEISGVVQPALENIVPVVASKARDLFSISSMPSIFLEKLTPLEQAKVVWNSLSTSQQVGISLAGGVALLMLKKAVYTRQVDTDNRVQGEDDEGGVFFDAQDSSDDERLQVEQLREPSQALVLYTNRQMNDDFSGRRLDNKAFLPSLGVYTSLGVYAGYTASKEILKDPFAVSYCIEKYKEVAGSPEVAAGAAGVALWCLKDPQASKSKKALGIGCGLYSASYFLPTMGALLDCVHPLPTDAQECLELAKTPFGIAVLGGCLYAASPSMDYIRDGVNNTPRFVAALGRNLTTRKALASGLGLLSGLRLKMGIGDPYMNAAGMFMAGVIGSHDFYCQESSAEDVN